MKKTLLTIALTTLVVLTLIGIVSTRMASPAYSTFTNVGFGGGGEAEYYAEAPVVSESFAFDAVGAPMEAKVASVEVANQVTGDMNRLVIKNADLAIVVKSPDADLEKIRALADELGGFVVASNTYKTTSGIDNISVNEISITIRVPAAALDKALATIKKDAVDVDYENVSGVDVTSEYVDLQSRLKAKEAAEKKLLEIMDDADETEDVLAVYVQLQSIQTEIEALRGQIKYYEESAAMSSISVRLIPERGAQPIEVKAWSPSGAWKEALERLDAFAKGFADFLITLVGFSLPALILVVLPLALVFFGGRALLRRFVKAKPKADVEVDNK